MTVQRSSRRIGSGSALARVVFAFALCVPAGRAQVECTTVLRGLEPPGSDGTVLAFCEHDDGTDRRSTLAARSASLATRSRRASSASTACGGPRWRRGSDRTGSAGTNPPSTTSSRSTSAPVLVSSRAGPSTSRARLVRWNGSAARKAEARARGRIGERRAGVQTAARAGAERGQRVMRCRSSARSVAIRATDRTSGCRRRGSPAPRRSRAARTRRRRT